MANAQRPSGLVPVAHLLGGLSDVAGTRVYYIPSGDSNAYAIGDPVASVTNAADANGVPAVTLATAGAGNNLRGVIVGFGAYEGLIADPTNLDKNIIPATKTKAYYALVIDDPYVVFEVQAYGSGSFTGTQDIGKNANLKSGTNNGYISGWTLDDSAAGNTGATYQMRLMGLARRSNNASGLYATYLCLINLHELRTVLTGI